MRKLLVFPFNATQLCLLFICLHVLVWTLAPTLVRLNLPMDAIEGAIWGHQLEWGYDKNPFLNGWLTALAMQFDNGSGWVIYLFSQLSVAICFAAVFFLGSRLLSPFSALVGVLLLEGMQYYNFHAIDFNDNTLELSTWALTTYFFYCAMTGPGRRAFGYWLLTAIFAALAMLTKYYSAVLIATLFLFLLQKENRHHFFSYPLYVSIALFILLLMPHIIWLFRHDFVTVTYVFERTQSVSHWWNHLYFPAEFAFQQLQVLIPLFLLVGVVWLLSSRSLIRDAEITKTTFNQKFLFFVGLGPLLITLTLALVFGIKLRAGWGMPIFSFAGLMSVALLNREITQKTASRFFIIILVVNGLLIAGYRYVLVNPSTASSANFPGKEIALAVTEAWHQEFHQPLKYVAGPRWLGGNVLFYSPDHPNVFMEWNQRKTTWFNPSDFNRQGAVFIWDIAHPETLPPHLASKYPTLLKSQLMTFHWQRGDLPPITIGIAFLPPSS